MNFKQSARDRFGQLHPRLGIGHPLSGDWVEGYAQALGDVASAERAARNAQPRSDPAAAFASALHNQRLSTEGDGDAERMARVQRDVECYQAGWAAAMARAGEAPTCPWCDTSAAPNAPPCAKCLANPPPGFATGVAVTGRTGEETRGEE